MFGSNIRRQPVYLSYQTFILPVPIYLWVKMYGEPVDRVSELHNTRSKDYADSLLALARHVRDHFLSFKASR